MGQPLGWGEGGCRLGPLAPRRTRRRRFLGGHTDAGAPTLGFAIHAIHVDGDPERSVVRDSGKPGPWEGHFLLSCPLGRCPRGLPPVQCSQVCAMAWCGPEACAEAEPGPTCSSEPAEAATWAVRAAARQDWLAGRPRPCRHGSLLGPRHRLVVLQETREIPARSLGRDSSPGSSPRRKTKHKVQSWEGKRPQDASKLFPVRSPRWREQGWPEGGRPRARASRVRESRAGG